MLTLKSVLKSCGVDIICFCAVFISTLFISYSLDIHELDGTLSEAKQIALFNGQIAMSKTTVAVSGGVLGVFAVLLLFFSVERYISENEANMGILKALGYTNHEISLPFCKFGLNCLIGTAVGYLSALAFIPLFYATMNADHTLPDIAFRFNFLVFLFLVLTPSLFFAAFAYLMARLKLRKTALRMIQKSAKNGKVRKAKGDLPFLKGLRKTILRNHVLLVVFVGFAALCYGATVQMSFSMDQVGTSPLFFWMMFLIGLLLGTTVLFLAFRFVYNANAPYLGLLKAYGYRDKECSQAVYGGYRLIALIGFGIGTVYQYLLMKAMLSFFANSYRLSFVFSWKGLLLSALLFAICYESALGYCRHKIKNTPIKETIAY